MTGSSFKDIEKLETDPCAGRGLSCHATNHVEAARRRIEIVRPIGKMPVRKVLRRARGLLLPRLMSGETTA